MSTATTNRHRIHLKNNNNCHIAFGKGYLHAAKPSKNSTQREMTMPRIEAACWAMTTGNIGGDSVDQRIRKLRNVLNISNLRFTRNPDVIKLFICPEYLFTATEEAEKTGIMKPLSHSGKHHIYNELTRMSALYPQVIMIAGSIFYRKTRFFDRRTFNVSPTLFDGQIVKKLYKVDQDDYTKKANFSTKTSGDKGVPLSSVGGISIGLDICSDYTAGFPHGRLGQYIERTKSERPAIHVQISGTNSSIPSRAEAQVNGVYIHCDLSSRKSSAFLIAEHKAQKGGARTSRISPSFQLKDSYGWLTFYDVTI